jgi:hypothetical protein
MDDGTELRADTIISGCNPYHTFLELMPENVSRDSGAYTRAKSGSESNEGDHGVLPKEFIRHIKHVGKYRCCSACTVLQYAV